MMTAAATILGTPAYMAPEAIMGDVEVDRRVDVYALGCVAYYLLTGERVFTAQTQVKLFMQHLQESPNAPSHRTAHRLPQALDRLVLDCLDKDPAKRPDDAAMVFRRLSDCAADEWTQDAAERWWATHLPHLAKPRTATLSTALSGSSALATAGEMAASS